MTGRQLIGALTRRPPAAASRLVPLPSLVPPAPQPGLRRPCGCDCDVRVFGHVCCAQTPPRRDIVMGPGAGAA